MDQKPEQKTIRLDLGPGAVTVILFLGLLASMGWYRHVAMPALPARAPVAETEPYSEIDCGCVADLGGEQG